MKIKSFLQSRLQAIRIAFEGLSYVLRTQPNVIVYLIFSVAAVSAGWIFKVTRFEWIILVIAIGLVWAAETFNTSVEELVDMISPGDDPRAKIVKDLSAGAVLITALLSVLVGILIFGPRIWAWVRDLF